MKNLLAIPLVALIAAGCVHSSVEPRSVIRIDRTATPSVARQAGAPNTPTADQADLGVAPYITQPAPGNAAAAANAVINAPSAAPAPGTPGTTGGAGTTTIVPAAGATSAGTITGIIASPTTTSVNTKSTTPATPLLGNSPGTPSPLGTATTSPTSGLNKATGSSLGSGLGGTSTGSATGLSTISTNNLLNPTNLFGPK